MRSLSLLALILLSACAASEQPDYGWVAKPKSAIIERYDPKRDRFDPVINREYYYTGQLLDSVVDQDSNSRSVYQKFAHSDNTYHIIPWDYTLTPNLAQDYNLDSTGKWVRCREREDSVVNGLIVATSYRYSDSAGDWHAMRMWEEFDTEGYRTAELRSNELGTVTGKHFQYLRDGSNKVVGMMQVGQSDTSWFEGTQLYDTNSYSLYRYDKRGKLVEIIDSTAPEWYDSRSLVMRYSEFDVFDTVAWFTKQVLPVVHVALPKRQVMKRGLITSRSLGRETQTRFTTRLDERNRIIEHQTDSVVMRADYFDDNTVKGNSVRNSTGELLHAERTLRYYNDQHHVTMQVRETYDPKRKQYIATARSYNSY